MHKMYFCGVCNECVGDDGSHLLFYEANVNYHLLHITYTTGVHNTFRAYHIYTHKYTFVVEVLSWLLTKGWKVESRGVGKYRPHSIEIQTCMRLQSCAGSLVPGIYIRAANQHRICWATKIGHPPILVNPR